MSYTEKIDVLEILIEILREHEAELDALITRLEEVEGGNTFILHPPLD